ncbi:DNA repair protein RadA/Sms [Peptoclostridium litorale DSM 5388]|uniref:DNA repair protein RadA n=1 Tax=Peptoclostridium litorale DSM 5388 TaxID=1121324 RepID=A0A069RB93_PEPLI|nr:DNA repair protein RadA [Peptoclostridium litorale]KDR94339.1 DNA repair protein RadA [Peptoclostridium litorale DSM 5388]SIO29249.1 DNA repair protein RadA/Sms [Peptoclostridium litorale DSM 5388]
MAKIKTKFICQNCGFETPKWMGKCPECSSWNSFEETVNQKETVKPSLSSIGSGISRAVPIDSIEARDEDRQSSGIKELDRVLGGGIVEGSLTLVGGDPGIGKSTILLQLSQNLANKNFKVLYISGEESAYQLSMRAKRLGISSPNLYIMAESNLEVIRLQVESLSPDYMIVDSIQTMFTQHITSTPGSVSQVKEATSLLMKISKSMGIATFIVGHVTKDGSIAGPRLLEHMVDTVLYFEGDRYNTYRMIRAVKNRFGSTNELGVFEMSGLGLMEVENPSKILISEKPKGVPGSVIVSTMEGTRPMLAEIQALVSPNSFGIPRRMCTGVDSSRMSLLLAVLEKRAGMQVQGQDVYLNVVGGIKLAEPAIDLGIVLSIASGFRNREIDQGLVAIGEVGLTGEVRGVNFIEKRIKECVKLGFTKAIVPKNNIKGIEKMKGIQLFGVQSIREALDVILGG